MADKKIDDRTAQNMADSTKVLAKAAGGPVGDAVAKGGDTKLGNSYLKFSSKQAMKNPMMKGFDKLSNFAADTGLLDAANKVLDAKNGETGEIEFEEPDLEGIIQKHQAENAPHYRSKNDDDEDDELPANQEQVVPSSSSLKDVYPQGLTGGTVSGGAGSKAKKKKKSDNDKKKKKDSNHESLLDKLPTETKMIIAAVIGGIALFSLLLVVIISGPFSIGDAIRNFWDGVVDFFTTDQQELEQQYYKELDKVQNEINQKEGVCVDINLITAALSLDKNWDEALEEGEETGTDSEGKNYKKMMQQIELLGYMQIKHIKYGWDDRLPVKSGEKSCKSSSESSSEELVSGDNMIHYNPPGLIFEENGRDSSKPEFVAQHDLESFWNFLLKSATKEKNYEYRLYQPAAVERCSEGTNSDGSCINGKKEDKCEATLPNETAEFDIGDESNILNTRDDSVFYWNLVNAFIPEYYADLLPADEPARTNRILEMAAEVYKLYSDAGPSHQCSNRGSSSSTQFGNSELCPGGIMVNTSSGIKIVPLEEYVAGVVAHEAYQNEGIEALKAQAVAARTFALNYTHGCTTIIGNDDRSQAYAESASPVAIQAATETAGEVMYYNGQVFSAMYDSFCIDDNDCPDSKTSTPNADGSYTVTYHKMPGGEENTFTLSDPAQYGRFVRGGGHARGMSQLMSYQLAKEGMDYHQILEFFYSSDIEYYKAATTGVSGPWSSWKQFDAQWKDIRLSNGYCCQVIYEDGVKKCKYNDNAKQYTNSSACTSAGGYEWRYPTIGGVGCYATSISILIAQSGVLTTLGNSFNPGTFISELINMGKQTGYLAFGPGGAWSGNAFTYMQQITNNGFMLDRTVTYQSPSQIADYLNQGYYIMVQVKNGGHYVAVNNVIGDTVNIVDPGWDIQTLNSYAGTIGSLYLFRVDPSAPRINTNTNTPSTIVKEPGSFAKGTYDGRNYYLYTPADTSSSKPLFVYLHGDGGGAPKNYPTAEGNFMGQVNSGVNYDAYILMPQAKYCAGSRCIPEWGDGGVASDGGAWKQELMSLINQVVSDNNIDSSRVSIWGFSNGAVGLAHLVNYSPNYFSAAVVMAGYFGNSYALRNIPTYAFVGDGDTSARSYTSTLYQNLSLYSNDVHFKVYPNQLHPKTPNRVLTDTDIEGGYSSIVDWAASKSR